MLASRAHSVSMSAFAHVRSSERACASANARADRRARARVAPSLSAPRPRASRAIVRRSTLSEIALAGVDTTAFDQIVIDGLRAAIPLYMAGVGALFVFGTVYKVAFPDKFDDAMYGKEAKKAVEGIDLDNLSDEDKAAVAALEAELKAKGKL